MCREEKIKQALIARTKEGLARDIIALRKTIKDVAAQRDQALATIARLQKRIEELEECLGLDPPETDALLAETEQPTLHERVSKERRRLDEETMYRAHHQGQPKQPKEPEQPPAPQVESEAEAGGAPLVEGTVLEQLWGYLDHKQDCPRRGNNSRDCRCGLLAICIDAPTYTHADVQTLVDALSQAAQAAYDEIAPDCGDIMGKAAYHAVRVVARDALTPFNKKE